MGFNLFSWWQGQTFGTWLMTARQGREVGRDADGNIYFEGRAGSSAAARRWVIYAHDNDSSRVPPEWHLWLHRTRMDVPTLASMPVKAWERPWRPNPTGSSLAETPRGALVAGGVRAAAAADYRPWSPDSPPSADQTAGQ